MKKKKTVIEEVVTDEVKEPEVVAVEETPPPAKAEPLLTVTVKEDFKDGALAARFAQYGYPVLWKAGETRSIPMNLFIRCKRSGARFEL